MALILLFESKSANTDSFLMLIRYQMYGTRARLDLGFSPFSLSSTSSFVATVTGMKVAKTVTSFLTLSPFEDTGWHYGPSFCSWSTQLGRSLFFFSWEWCWYLLQVSLGLAHVLAYAKDFCSILDLSSGWRRKFVEWKMTASHKMCQQKWSRWTYSFRNLSSLFL